MQPFLALRWKFILTMKLSHSTHRGCSKLNWGHVRQCEAWVPGVNLLEIQQFFLYEALTLLIVSYEALQKLIYIKAFFVFDNTKQNR